MPNLDPHIVPPHCARTARRAEIDVGPSSRPAWMPWTSPDEQAVRDEVASYKIIENVAAAACPSGDSHAMASTWPRRQAEQPKSATCTDDAARLRALDLRLLVGVMSAPSMRARRDAIRSTWFSWVGTHNTVACFAFGRVGPLPAELAALDAEAAATRDVIFLPNASDGCNGRHMHISKLHGWWARAAAFVRAVDTLRYVAKVDDDAYLHLPNLHHDLRRLDCVEHFVYGTIAWIGIRPYPLSKCGYSWPQDAGVFLKRGCHTRGHRPPHPFPVGILQVLSRGVVQYVGENSEVSAFAARAASLSEPSRGEDQVLGFWASRARLDGGLDVAYVKAGPQMGDLRCGDDHVFDLPKRQAPPDAPVAVHHIKVAGGMRYVDGLLRLNVRHTERNCTRFCGAGAFRECWSSADLNCRPSRSYRAATPLGWRAGERRGRKAKG